MSNGNRRNMNERAIKALHPHLQRKQKEMYKDSKSRYDVPWLKLINK